MDLRLKFNEDVVNYDKMRPTYVTELFDDVIRYSHLDSDKEVLEIGIGTGQATLPFLNIGCTVTAVELGKELAAFSKNKFAEFSKFNIINSDFESAKLENNRYDLIYSATAFHWIAQEEGYLKTHQLLKSGGVLALFWNHASRVDDELDYAMQEVYKKYRSNTQATVHKFSEEKCLEIRKNIEKYGFINAEYKLYYRTRTFDVRQYMLLLNTYSDHRARKEDIRLSLEKELTRVINTYGGTVDIQDTMDLYLARKP